MSLILPKRRLIVPAIAAGVLAAPAIILAPKIADALVRAGLSDPSRITDVNALPPKVKAAFRRAMLMQAKMAGMMGGGRVPASTLSVRDTATSTGANITIPAATQAGDIIILFQQTNSGGGAVDTGNATPTGGGTVVDSWTVFGGGTTVGVYHANMVFGIATASAASTSITGLGDTTNRKAMLVIYGDVPIVAADLGLLADVDQAVSTNPSGGTLSTGSRVPPMVGFCGFSSSGAISPRTFSPSADGNVSPGTNMYLDYKIYNSSPSNISVDMDDEGSANYVIGGYIRIRQ